MKKLFAILALFVSPLAAQITDSAVMVQPFASQSECLGVSSIMLSEQKPHSAFLPLLIHTGAGEQITQLAIYQASIYDSPTLSDVPAASLPVTRIVTSGNCNVYPYSCAGVDWGSYVSVEYWTHADAISYINNTSSYLRPSCYGPFATPRGSYLVSCATLGLWIQGS